jgi:hypothetical protein
MPPDNPTESPLRALLGQLAAIGGVAAIVSVICGLLDLTPQHNAGITIASFCFLVIVWWWRTVNRVPSALILALLIPTAIVVFYLLEGDACFRQAKRAKKPYVLQSITYFVRVEADPSGSQFSNVSHRIVYSMRATRDIKDSEDVFDEEIHSDQDRAVIQRWPGTEKELQHADTKPEKFKVMFPLHADETRTIVTGANFRIPYPYKERTILDSQQSAGPNDDTISYPNSGDDVICELVMVVESSSFGLSEISHSGMPTESVTKIDRGGVTTISARWMNVKPHENLWIHYKLEPRSTPNTNANQNK